MLSCTISLTIRSACILPPSPVLEPALALKMSSRSSTQTKHSWSKCSWTIFLPFHLQLAFSSHPIRLWWSPTVLCNGAQMDVFSNTSIPTYRRQRSENMNCSSPCLSNAMNINVPVAWACGVLLAISKKVFRKA